MNNTVEEIASKLWNAYQEKKPISFIRHQYDLDEATAYNVQDALVSKRCEEEHAEVAGYKISMTSDDTQAIAGTDEPAYGTLLTSDVVQSGGTVSLDSLFAPLIEPEIMFLLIDNLTPGAGAEEIIQKSRLAAGIEIPDARYTDWFPNFSLADLLSDNAATGLVAVSDAIEPLSIDALEKVSMGLFHDQEKIAEGESSAVLGNPVEAVAWLSRKLAAKNRILKKDMIISSGTFISPLPVKKGTYLATYSNIGKVEVTFVP